MKYAVIIEKAGNNYSAYAPDVPGCGATGETVDETLDHIKEAIEFHLQGLKEEGLPLPQSSTICDYVETKMIHSVA